MLFFEREQDKELILALAIFFAWFRCISYLRLWNETRYLMNMIIEIGKEIRAFILIFFAFCLTITFTLKALRPHFDFEELWQVAYRLGYGDFEEEYATRSERILFLIGTILLPLVLLNLLIAIMGEKYGQLQSDIQLSDIVERLSLIKEIGKIIRCKRRPRPEYIHVVSTDLILNLDQERTEMEETVYTIESAIKASEKVTKDEIQNLNLKIEGVEENIGNVEKRLNTKIDDLSNKMDQILGKIVSPDEVDLLA